MLGELLEVTATCIADLHQTRKFRLFRKWSAAEGVTGAGAGVVWRR
jgi:hypothetical protein